MLTEEQKSNPLVQNLLNYLSEDAIEKSIDSGAIKLDKEDPSKKDDKEDKKKKDDGDGEGAKKDDKIEKSLEGNVELKETFEKSFNSLTEVMKSQAEATNAALAGMTEAMKIMSAGITSMGQQTPSFRSGPFTNADVIEKSIKEKADEAGKVPVSLSNREAARPIIERIYNNAEPEIQKSIAQDFKHYWMDSNATTIGPAFAEEAYRQGIRLQK